MKFCRILAEAESFGKNLDIDLKFTLIAAVDESNQMIKAEWFGGYSDSTEFLSAFKVDSDGLLEYGDSLEKTNILDKIIKKGTYFSVWENGLNDELDNEDEWLFKIKSVHIYEY